MTIVKFEDRERSFRLDGSAADEARAAGMDMASAASALAIALQQGFPERDLVIVEAVPGSAMHMLLTRQSERYGLIGGMPTEELAQMRSDIGGAPTKNIAAISSRAWLMDVFERTGIDHLIDGFKELATSPGEFPLIYETENGMFLGEVTLVHMN